MHTAPGPEDEEFYVAGSAMHIDDPAFRSRAWQAMEFVTSDNENEILFELRIDRGLWTRWLDFGTPGHRPEYHRWRA